MCKIHEGQKTSTCILVMIMTHIAVVLKLSDHKSQLSECQMCLIVSHTNLPVR